MPQENLKKIIELGGEILRKRGHELLAAEINPDYALATCLADTSMGRARLTISVYRGSSYGSPYLDGEVIIVSMNNESESTRKWSHRTRITNGATGPYTAPDDVEVITTMFGRFFIEDNFWETTISNKVALSLLQEVAQGNIEIDGQLLELNRWQPYSKEFRDDAEKSGRIMGDLGVYF